MSSDADTKKVIVVGVVAVALVAVFGSGLGLGKGKGKGKPKPGGSEPKPPGGSHVPRVWMLNSLTLRELTLEDLELPYAQQWGKGEAIGYWLPMNQAWDWPTYTFEELTTPKPEALILRLSKGDNEAAEALKDLLTKHGISYAEQDD